MALGIGEAIGGALQAGGAIYSAFRNPASEDARQIRQQQKFTDMQSKANNEAMKNSAAQQLEMWKKTGVVGQKEQMLEAGINPATMFGMSGGGGVTTGSASQGGVSSGQAANAAATEANKLTMGMQLAQMGLMTAQAEKTKAETENLKAGTGKTEVDTAAGKLELDTKQKTQEATIQTITETAAKTLAEAVQAQQKQVINEETMKDQIRSIQEEAINKILKNEGETIENRRKEANLAVEQFEAKMAESGISPRTPWYMKLIVDLLDKIGINPLK